MSSPQLVVAIMICVIIDMMMARLISSSLHISQLLWTGHFISSPKCYFVICVDLKGAEEFCMFLSKCIFIQNALPAEIAKLKLVWPPMHLR